MVSSEDFFSVMRARSSLSLFGWECGASSSSWPSLERTQFSSLGLRQNGDVSSSSGVSGVDFHDDEEEDDKMTLLLS
jgi:hypothetical protein